MIISASTPSDNYTGDIGHERAELFAKALSAAKQALDPKAILNPGVLVDPK